MGTSSSIGRHTFGKPSLPPQKWSFNITFSPSWNLPGVGDIVNLTVPQTTFQSTPGYEYESELGGWLNHTTTLQVDGYGWLFLGATGDVDCYTSNNSTGAYWVSPSPMAGTMAADPGQFPSPGSDGVAGTSDDGFGDGANDIRGSSILYMKTTVATDYATFGTGWNWEPLFTYDMIQVWTTAVAYDIVTEDALNGVWAKFEGHAWEFFSGDDPGGTTVPYDHPKWNAYVTYAMSWSQHDIFTGLDYLDLLMAEKRKLVRFDCAIADITCDEVCNIIDIVKAALAFDKEDQNLGPDGQPGTGDDVTAPDPGYDPQGDVSPLNTVVNIVDIVRIALDFDERLEP